MTKQTTTIQIDDIIRMKARKLGIKLTPFINRALEQVVNQYEGATINIFELKERIKEIDEKQKELTEERNNITVQIFAYEEKEMKEKEMKEKVVDSKMDGIKASGILGEIGG